MKEETQQQKLAREMTHKHGKVDQSARDNPLTGSAMQALARGWLAGTIGMPGDLEGLGRAGLNALGAGVDKHAALPTTDFFKEWLPGKQTGDENVATVGSMLGGAGMGTIAKGTNKAARALPGALTQMAKNAAVPRTLSPQAGVIKAPGGNWLSGSVEDALRGLKPRVRTEGINGHTATDTLADQAMGQFIDKQLTRYVKNDMATERDPIRALAERGTLHVNPEQFNFQVPMHGKYLEEGQTAVAQAPGAKAWEGASDMQIAKMNAGELLKGGTWFPDTAAISNAAERNPWLATKPDAEVVAVRDRMMAQDLGFDHLIDELRNATNPQSGLPRELLLKPESLDRVSVPQAVEHVAKINAWREAQKVEANAAKANNAATHVFKEYAENNPKGLKWVELKQASALPDGWKQKANGDFIMPDGRITSTGPQERDLSAALKYEGDTMGHCVGGYCDDVASGASRIFSLRDAKGQPHVTVEVKPGGGHEYAGEKNKEIIRLAEERGIQRYMAPGNEDLWAEAERNLAERGIEQPKYIQQIKGKGNRKPNDEYLPFVQDFVKSGKWSDVGDLNNTGLTKHASGYLTADELRALGNPPKFAQGGPVPTTAEIQQFYAAHKNDANLGEQALRAMRETGLTRERINSVMKPETTRVWSGDDYVYRTDPGAEAAMAKLWGDVDQAEKQQEWSAFTATNPLDTNAATGRGTGTDVSKYTDRQQTLQDFLKENAAFINPDGTIKSPELGGNYHYSGQNAIDVYKKNIGQTYNTYETETWTPKAPSVYNNALSLAWIPGVENKGSFLEGLAKVGLAGAGMYFGLPALLGGAATGAGAASGLAGMAGMDAGLAATALNSGALNTGMNLLRGQNIGDAIKGGATSALLSPIGTLAGNAATSAFGGYGISPELLKAIGTTTGSAATGAARAVATGKPLGRGFIDGAVDGLVASAGNYVGGRTAGATNSKFAGTAANNLTRASLRGGVNKNTINSLAEMYASGKLTDLSGLEPEVARTIVSVAARRTTPVGALSSYVGAVGSKSMRKAAVGGR